MTTVVEMRRAYASDAVHTASPSRLVTMLYDRLVRDLDRAELAMGQTDIEGAHNALRHAQDIVSELSNSLDVEGWADGEQLRSLYIWLKRQLVTANVTKDPAHLVEVREVVEPLREAWHEAANSTQAAVAG